MQDDRKIVRVNVEVVYDDGTFEELKGVTQVDDPNATSGPSWIAGSRVLSTRHAGGPLLCVPR